MPSLSDRFPIKPGEFQDDPRVTRHYAAGVGALRMELKAGALAGKHYHHYSHLSVLVKGIAIVHVEDKWTRYEAGSNDVIEIPAGVEHVIQAVTDCVWVCIHATGDGKDFELLQGKH